MNNVDLTPLKGRRVLVTGAGGLICSAFVDLLVQDPDVRVCATDVNFEWLGRRFAGVDRVEVRKWDVMEPLDVDGRVDVILHGASPASPNLFVSNPVETMWANLHGLHELLEYARRHEVRKVVYISSSEVYGRMAPGGDGFKEDDAGFVELLSPRSSYSMGKRASETLCAAYVAEYGLDVSIVRPGHIYGPTCSPADRRVSSAWAWQAARGEPIVMKSSGRSLRSYTHCADCATALVAVIERGARGEAYNIANREGACTIRRMAEILSAAGGVPLRIEAPSESESSAFNPMDDSRLDPSRLEALGWKGVFGPEEGFKQTVEQLKRRLA